LETIPGVGRVYCDGILAEIGGIHQFDFQAAVAKHAGSNMAQKPIL